MSPPDPTRDYAAEECDEKTVRFLTGEAEMPRRKGRPVIYKTEEARRAAKARSTAKSNAKVKNITVDADMVEALNTVADELAGVFGFRPTISQTLRHLINKRTA